VPGTPGAPSEFRWMDRDLNSTSGGYCGRGETDGTGHIALSWQNPWQPHSSKFAFLDPATGSQVGSYDKGIRLDLIGQASGFMGANCVGSICQSNYVVLDPAGKSVYESPYQGQTPGLQANDPTGGMIHARYDPPNPGYGDPVTNEYAGLIWDDRSAKREEHPNCPNHLTDATLYAWRYCYAYLSEIPPPKPKPYTNEWYDQEMEEAEVERYLALEAERSEADEWGYGWEGPRPEPISWRSFKTATRVSSV
jgi:hypothetical protein